MTILARDLKLNDAIYSFTLPNGSATFVPPPGDVFKVTSVSVADDEQVAFSLDSFPGVTFTVTGTTLFDAPKSVDAMFFFRTSSPVTAKLPGASDKGRQFWANAHSIVGFDGTVYKSEGWTTEEGVSYTDHVGF